MPRIGQEGHAGQAGTASRSTSSCLPLSSWPSVVTPVTFPPGRARLLTSPWATGSPAVTMTMGIVAVAALAARTPGVEPVTMTLTLRRTPYEQGVLFNKLAKLALELRSGLQSRPLSAGLTIEGDKQLADERKIQEHRGKPVDVADVARDPSCTARFAQSPQAASTIPAVNDPARAEVKELDGVRLRSGECVEESFPPKRRPPVGGIEVPVIPVARDIDEGALALRNSVEPVLEVGR